MQSTTTVPAPILKNANHGKQTTQPASGHNQDKHNVTGLNFMRHTSAFIGKKLRCEKGSRIDMRSQYISDGSYSSLVLSATTTGTSERLEETMTKKEARSGPRNADCLRNL